MVAKRAACYTLSSAFLRPMKARKQIVNVVDILLNKLKIKRLYFILPEANVFGDNAF